MQRILVFLILATSLECYAGLEWKKTKKTINYGLYDTKKVVDFEYQNMGTKSIKITQIQMSCACLKVTYPKKTISPQETGKISVTYIAEETDKEGVNMLFAVATSLGKKHLLTLRAIVDHPLKLSGRSMKWVVDGDALKKSLTVNLNSKLKSITWGELKNRNSLSFDADYDRDGEVVKSISAKPKWVDRKIISFLTFTVSYKDSAENSFKKKYKIRVSVD